MPKHKVLLRENCQCAFPGCTRRSGEGHHLEYHSHGGCNELWNLIFLCAAHHRAGQHGGKVTIWGRAPHDVYFQAGTPTACGGGYPIWKNDRLVRTFATVAEARTWARDQKREFER
jgi:hypothetical protein